MSKEQFSRWLMGFIDAEGNFQVYLDRGYLRVMFRIRLHVDDIQVLYKIRDFLGVGRVKSCRTNCVFIISNLHELHTVLIPLIYKYRLFTTKWLDFMDFRLVVNQIREAGTSKLTSAQLAWAISIIEGMNSTRHTYNYSIIPKAII
uniref:LAGLIDADG endonuclease n=1 Tax=Powellomyces hirtus TaxID=109895 RepID=A0A4P8NPF9_9FUNG|nr:LAGLIDADG endonuclease [Powellomyces hirtus]